MLSEAPWRLPLFVMPNEMTAGEFRLWTSTSWELKASSSPARMIPQKPAETDRAKACKSMIIVEYSAASNIKHGDLLGIGGARFGSSFWLQTFRSIQTVGRLP